MRSSNFPLWGRYLLVFGGGIILLAAMLFLNITQGEAGIGIQTVIDAIIAPQDVADHNVIRTLRLSRATMGVLAGAVLAAAGVLLQTITRNPLSSTETLGINSGAFLAVNMAAVFFPAVLSSYSLIVAFIGGLAAIGLAYAMAGGLTASPLRLTLAGMAVTLAIGAVTGTLQLMYEENTSRLLAWGSGSLEQANWNGVRFVAPWILPAALMAVALSKSLDLFELGDEMAQSLGQRVRLVRMLALILAVLLAAATVSVVGGIGFIGLIAPHLMRLIGIRRHLPLLISSMIWGAIVLLVADTLARMVADGSNELSAGAVTAIIGGPWMIWLAMRARKGGGHLQSSSDSSSLASRLSRRTSYPVLLAILSALFVIVWIAGISLGSLRLHLSDIIAVMAGGGDDLTRSIVFNMRLPRMLVAAVAGAALAASGLLLQGVVKNPLADPSIIGVSTGAGVGALLLLIALPGIHISWLPTAALAGAFASAAIVYAVSRRSGMNPTLLVLVGVAVSAMGSGIIQLLVIQAKIRASAALAWLAGSTYARTWEQLWPLMIWPAVLLPIAWWLIRKLDLLALSDEVPTGLGIHVARTRVWAGFIGVALAAAAVATVGTVGFVGLIAPHAARILIGHNHRRLLPATLLIGALLLMAADLVGRLLLSPKEIPSGLVVALLGAPYFIALMRKSASRK
ncbi:iron complex transport system permease protein [Paenibacillus forsythiae]|uniref:Iron complex transport system permease protein n=4 Tax=Paenibacillus forsythiae TaxID=365616 RepID=A0ABU3H2C2_9BACL|nr:iron ABC transporter permease [Paenibacillus forsythiae]MDT3424962.1 iron complex transport system permease protein [Paenibacillus forsythiae]